MNRRGFLRGVFVTAVAAPMAKMVDLAGGDPMPGEFPLARDTPLIDTAEYEVLDDQWCMTTVSTCDTLDGETLRQMVGHGRYRGGA